MRHRVTSRKLDPSEWNLKCVPRPRDLQCLRSITWRCFCLLGRLLDFVSSYPTIALRRSFMVWSETNEEELSAPAVDRPAEFTPKLLAIPLSTIAVEQKLGVWELMYVESVILSVLHWESSKRRICLGAVSLDELVADAQDAGLDRCVDACESSKWVNRNS